MAVLAAIIKLYRYHTIQTTPMTAQQIADVTTSKRALLIYTGVGAIISSIGVHQQVIAIREVRRTNRGRRAHTEFADDHMSAVMTTMLGSALALSGQRQYVQMAKSIKGGMFPPKILAVAAVGFVTAVAAPLWALISGALLMAEKKGVNHIEKQGTKGPET